jgi:hypothetical protein
VRSISEPPTARQYDPILSNSESNPPPKCESGGISYHHDYKANIFVRNVSLGIKSAFVAGLNGWAVFLQGDSLGSCGEQCYGSDCGSSGIGWSTEGGMGPREVMWNNLGTEIKSV